MEPDWWWWGYVFWLIDFAFKDDMNPIGHSLIGMLGSLGGILIFVGIVHDFCLITGKRQRITSGSAASVIFIK